MKASIATAFVDSRAADLSLAYGLAPLPALSTHLVRLSGARIELRVLGASHQVVLQIGGACWSETVACLPDRPGRLPSQHQADSGPLRARFDATCQRLSPTRFVERVRTITRRCEQHPRALVGAFPGSPLAITALLVNQYLPDELSWRSWHAYPQNGELVSTASVVTQP